ncbi:MAG: hypothetical protein CL798_07225 [Chromatiales bacterium]|jgi:pimeloyl-ACP methyl ester carboxylesterase|nr:hypothetical protein [Chromatiales bacterium]
MMRKCHNKYVHTLMSAVYVMVLLVATLVMFAAGGCVQQSASDVVSAYQPDSGPYRIRAAGSVQLPFAGLEKNLNLRITYPVADAGASGFPVIIFSHGGRCSRDRYSYFAEHWASHGYIVIQPAHLDSSSLPPPKIRGMQMMQEAVRTRRLDMVHILDSFEQIADLVPDLEGRIDANKVVAAGHSLGGGTAMSVTGLVMVDPSNNTEFGFTDKRFDALLLLTNPGNSPMMPDDPWRAVALPTFIASGTNDYSGLVRFIKKSKSVFRFPDDMEFAATGNTFLFVDDMDHYLGGLICKPRDGDTPDTDAARIIGGISVAFLAANLHADEHARALLENPGFWQTESRATLSIR